MADLSKLSDEEIIRHLPDEVLLQHIQGQAQSPQAPKTFADLNPLQKAFAPANVVREGIGNQVGNTLQTIQQLLGATGLGQVASAATAPPIRALAAMAPRQIGQTAGIAASLPVDPSTYAFGGISRIPSQIARSALGATAGGLAAAGQANPDALGVMGGMALGGLGSGLTRSTPQGLQADIPRVPNIPDFLRGNPKAIQGIKAEMQATEDAVAQTAHNTVKQFRQRGTFHDQISQFLRDKSTEAWAPMKSVTASIPDPITTQEIKSAASNNPLVANNPERLQALNVFLDDVLQSKTLPQSGRKFTGSASDWSDLSSEIGMTMRRAGLKGTSAKNFSELVSTDLRTAIGTVLQAKAPQHLQGAVSDAMFGWGNYAADRDTLFKYLQPGAAPNVSTNPGTAFLVKAVKGELTPFEQEFFNRMQAESGINVMTPFQQHMKDIADQGRRLMKAQSRGETGKTIAKVAPYLTGAGIAHEVFRRRP